MNRILQQQFQQTLLHPTLEVFMGAMLSVILSAFYIAHCNMRCLPLKS